MHGILVIDKPQGLTSHTVVQRVRHSCKVKRVGHAGTLDPLATGLLVIGIGKCTRLIEYLVASEKSYRATFVLGKVTDSQDITGEVVSETCSAHVTEEMIYQACANFVGTIQQVPPMFSALKKNGVPLYRLARQGVEVERQKRQVTIRSLNVEHINDNEITIVVDCSKGTYIRTLCHDIGQQLGCGACMTSLRRTRSGCFDESMSITMDELVDGDYQLLPATAALQTMIPLVVTVSGRESLLHGIPPLVTDIVDGGVVQDGDQVAFYYDGKLLAVASFDPAHLLDDRGDFKLEKVFPEGI